MITYNAMTFLFRPRKLTFGKKHENEQELTCLENKTNLLTCVGNFLLQLTSAHTVAVINETKIIKYR